MDDFVIAGLCLLCWLIGVWFGWLVWQLPKLREKNAAPCKPLTDAQIGAVAADIWGSVLIAPQSYQAFARAIEAKLREKNA